jgi:hypothetical protein
VSDRRRRAGEEREHDRSKAATKRPVGVGAEQIPDDHTEREPEPRATEISTSTESMPAANTPTASTAAVSTALIAAPIHAASRDRLAVRLPIRIQLRREPSLERDVVTSHRLGARSGGEVTRREDQAPRPAAGCEITRHRDTRQPPRSGCEIAPNLGDPGRPHARREVSLQWRVDRDIAARQRGKDLHSKHLHNSWDSE